MAERIRAHRSARPPEWEVVEAPMGLLGAIEGTSGDTSVILDCITLWGANALAEGPSGGDILGEARKGASTLATRAAPSVVVSNEVGLGIVPANELARRYRDLLGRVNASFAAGASRCFFVVAGRGLPLEEVTPT